MSKNWVMSQQEEEGGYKRQADQIKDPSQDEDFTHMHECSNSQMPPNPSPHAILKKKNVCFS